jgi:hypothetical protein
MVIMVVAMTKEIKALNDERAKLMNLYAVNFDVKLAEKELSTFGNLRELEDYVYTNLIKKGKTAIDVIKMLRDNHNISTMAAAHLCQLATESVFNSVDTRKEFCLSFNEAKSKIGQLNDMLEKTLAEGEDSEGNPEAIIAEIREWTKIKNDLIKVGTQMNILTDTFGKSAKVDNPLGGLSLEELQRKLGG